MNKALITTLLIGGMFGNISQPLIQPAAAETIPTINSATPEAQIELLSPGVEPRQELKFRPTANSQQTMTMTMGMTMNMKMGDIVLPNFQIPKVLMKINLKVSQVDSNGDIHYGFSYRDINVIADKNTNPEIIAAMKKSFKGIAGIKGNLVITSSGKVKNKKFIVPKTIDPMLSQTLEQLNKSTDQLSVSFPSSTVGLGAKWRVNNSIETMGIKFNQASTYEVLKIDRQGMTIKTDIVQSSPTQDIVLPGVPKGFKAKIISLNSTGGGTYVVKFNSLLPISGQLSINTDTQMSMQFESTKPPVKIDSQLLVDLNMMTK